MDRNRNVLVERELGESELVEGLISAGIGEASLAAQTVDEDLKAISVQVARVADDNLIVADDHGQVNDLRLRVVDDQDVRSASLQTSCPTFPSHTSKPPSDGGSEPVHHLT